MSRRMPWRASQGKPSGGERDFQVRPLLVSPGKTSEKVEHPKLEAVLLGERVQDAMLPDLVLDDRARPVDPGAEDVASHVATRDAHLGVATDSLDLVRISARVHDELA